MLFHAAPGQRRERLTGYGSRIGGLDRDGVYVTAEGYIDSRRGSAGGYYFQGSAH